MLPPAISDDEETLAGWLVRNFHLTAAAVFFLFRYLFILLPGTERRKDGRAVDDGRRQLQQEGSDGLNEDGLSGALALPTGLFTCIAQGPDDCHNKVHSTRGP